MNPLITVAAFWLTPPLLIAAYFLVDSWTERRREARRRAQQDREVTAEWLAVLAAPETGPVYDQLMCESIERAEGWAS